MTDEERKTPNLVLLAAPRGGWSRLVPEEGATFDLTLKNDGPAPETVMTLDYNQGTPVVRVRDEKGALVLQANPMDLDHRLVGETGDQIPSPPKTVDLAPGEEHATWINLWNYAPPLPPGRYELEVEHRIPSLFSNRAPFEIVPASVGASATGYDSVMRMASLLVWTAAPPGEPHELYARTSGFSDHATVQQGGTSFGEVPAGARLALSLFAGGMSNWQGWLAVVSEDRVEIHRHVMGTPKWKSEPVVLPISQAAPVPRFPDRAHAVFLATGARDGQPALAGFTVAEGAAPAAPWTVPLSAPVRHAACAFGPSGDITVLHASDDGKESELHRIGVDEAGAVTSAEELIRATPNVILAVAAEVRFGAPPAFIVLEADRADHDRVAWYRAPASGDAVRVPALARLPGWPVAAVGGAARPLAAKEIALEAGFRGEVLLALVDERGSFHGGVLSGGSVGALRKGGGSAGPQALSMRARHGFSCFTEQGSLFHAGDH